MTDLTEEGNFVPDKLMRAEKRIAASPYDTEAWSILIRDAQSKNIEDARTIYERLISQFANAGRYWKIYIDHEMKSRNYDKVEKLFQRCLMKVFNIELWKAYLSYIKETKVNLPSYREKMAQAYDFALDKIGMDVLSYQIWVDYIAFLKSVEAVGSYAENQRIAAVRKVYQRGVVNPMLNIESLWKEYCHFETSINPLISKKMQEDRSRDYTNARRVAKEYEVVTKGLNKNAPSVPPQNTPDEIKQVELWKKYISWEKSNPLRTEDTTIITKRVMFAYEQCLLCLGHHPDIWIEAASYLDQSSHILIEKGADITGKAFAEESAGIYERAITTLLKNNILLFFTYADFEESRVKYEKVHTIYRRCVEIPDVDPTLSYVQYMRFARRAEGIKSARLVFKMAREDVRIKYHVYVAAALMEYYCSKDSSIALKIFELAFKKFGQQVEFVREYLDYISHLNEDNNTRVLFERILTSGQLQNDKSQDIWNKFVEFEVNIGDLSSIIKVEKRRAQVFASEFEGKETALLIDRYKYLDLYPCQPSELKALGHKDLLKQVIVGVNSVDVEAASTVSDLEEDLKKSKFPTPDTSQMLPFKPRVSAPPDAHIVPGGIFPPPPIAAELLSRLPPPHCFNGPFVIIDKFIEHLMALKIPDDSSITYENGVDMRNFDAGTQLSIDIALGRKRKLDTTSSSAADESDDESTQAPPMNDIYRLRQQKKVK